MDERYTSVNAASEASGISVSHVRRLLVSGRVKGRKLGRDWIVDSESLMEFVSNRPKRGRKSTRQPLDKQER
jgi:hypothetical protein